ncbi:hypothetical protein [Lelliottia amnigena]|uniref:hypothetical protein n=1 Tax=Lelliottia amnigena TaxID=61646 RepID=UPI0019582248|nr:hypothetical protein [Lelliottia amnigena]MBM7354603.1 hypothetical protein [Lelliottia amnigena]WSO20985.1 hypothetical protein VUJ45_07410 [Lelliottia amnigena]
MRKFLIFLFVFLASCSSSKIKFTPEGGKLPNAKVGTFYQQNVVLVFQGSGEVISLNPNNFRVKITPEHSGLNVEPNFSGCENVYSVKCNDYYSKPVIKGVPNTKGMITVEIVAKTYPSMYSKSQIFIKKYQISVD